MEVHHVEGESPTTLGGYRGMGEGGTIGAPAAIANALSDALSPLGIGITELPATPERLFRLVMAALAPSPMRLRRTFTNNSHLILTSRTNTSSFDGAFMTIGRGTGGRSPRHYSIIRQPS